MFDRNEGRDAPAQPEHLQTIRIPSLQEEYELHRFGGLQALKETGHYKEVRLADPFNGGRMLHFPSSLHADNWILSCFGRGDRCEVPESPLQALRRGELLTVRCSLLVRTSAGVLADFVMRRQTEMALRTWQRFTAVAIAHKLTPVLRTPDVIRADPVRLRSLERMRQVLLQNLNLKATPEVRRCFKEFLKCTPPWRTVGDLRQDSRLRLPPGAWETALIELYREGAVWMNVSEAMYGDRTRIELL